MIRAAHSCKCENNNLRPGYLRSAVVVFTGITWPAAACHLLLFHFRRKHHVHLLAVELGHHLHLGHLLEVGGKAQQEDFTLLLEDDRATAEEDIGLDLRALLEEVHGVLELEVVVVVVGLGTETDLLDGHLRLVGLQLFGLLLLLVEELLVVGNAADGRIRLGRDLDEVQFHLVRKAQSVADRHDLRLFHVVSDDAYFGSRDLFVDAVRILLFGQSASEAVVRCRFRSVIPGVERPRREWFRCCDSCKVLVNIK